MKRILFGFLLGIAVTCAAIWYFGDRKKNATAEDARQRIEDTAKDAGRTVEKTLNSWGLSPDAIKDEFAKGGRVIRRKAENAGTAIADAASDARITATIKGKLVADTNLSALSISVTTTDGMVTLSGTASSAENVQKAISLAMETDGVREVVSTIQVK